MVIAAVLLSANAWAFDGTEAARKYDAARPACRQGEFHGKPISVAESAEQCRILAELGKELKANGYCWNATKQEWATCK